jgi:hypothetical protein
MIMRKNVNYKKKDFIDILQNVDFSKKMQNNGKMEKM